MANYYVDPAASGTNDGSSWTDAWTSLQTALDTVTAGNTIYCRGTQTLSATIDFDTQAGDTTSGFIKLIGCNASGTVDGTRFILDANNGSRHVSTWTATAKMYWLENIEFKNTASGTYYGVNFSVSNAGQASVFINCCVNDVGAVGWYQIGNATYSRFIRCVAYSNGGAGFFGGVPNTLFFFCCSRDNATHGFNDNETGGTYIGCIAHGNTNYGWNNVGNPAMFMNCIADGNGDGGLTVSGALSCSPILLGCRITNHSGAGDIGLNANSEVVSTGWCYFEDNDGDNIQNATLHYNIPLEGGSSSSNLEDLANTDEGYVDKTNHNFSTHYVDSGDPDLRRTAITVPWS